MSTDCGDARRRGFDESLLRDPPTSYDEGSEGYAGSPYFTEYLVNKPITPLYKAVMNRTPYG